ncbi:hypothetical protein ANN_19320 [Periplaneta americana]|uniref:Uncharacterized protein n=1 Tax=Periplaneta americana TaxID=6978 RepID=A0ABQ8SA43_PERAM|nr:hypothetical protein ANN_19320 [Periplaneta americana]
MKLSILNINNSQESDKNTQPGQNVAVAKAYNLVSQMLLDNNSITENEYQEDKNGTKRLRHESDSALTDEKDVKKEIIPETLCSQNTAKFYNTEIALDCNKATKIENKDDTESTPKKQVSQADYWKLKPTPSASSRESERKLKQTTLSLARFVKKQDLCTLKEFNGGVRQSVHEDDSSTDKISCDFDEDVSLQLAIQNSIQEKENVNSFLPHVAKTVDENLKLESVGDDDDDDDFVLTSPNDHSRTSPQRNSGYIRMRTRATSFDDCTVHRKRDIAAKNASLKKEICPVVRKKDLDETLFVPLFTSTLQDGNYGMRERSVLETGKALSCEQLSKEVEHPIETQGREGTLVRDNDSSFDRYYNYFLDIRDIDFSLFSVRRYYILWVVVITEDVQNVHLLLEYRPHIDVSLTCEHDPKLQEYCVCPQNMPQFDSEGIPNQALETNKPMILNVLIEGVMFTASRISSCTSGVVDLGHGNGDVQMSSDLDIVTLPTNTLYAFLDSPICATCPAHLKRLDLMFLIMSSEEYNVCSSALCNFLYSPVTSSL